MSTEGKGREVKKNQKISGIFCLTSYMRGSGEGCGRGCGRGKEVNAK